MSAIIDHINGLIWSQALIRNAEIWNEIGKPDDSAAPAKEQQCVPVPLE